MQKIENFRASRLNESQTNILWTALCFLTTCLIAVIDYLTGNELGLSLFYLAPVLAATWYVTIAVGVSLAIFSAFSWTLANSFLRVAYSHAFIPYWNVGVRSLFFITVVILLARLKKALLKERQFARKDFLTGIANWQAFTERAANEMNRARRYNRPITVVYADCDNFKQVNDWGGHGEGNKLLKLIARTMKENIRSFDIVARLGGDEFVLLLPETDQDNARVIVERLKTSLCAVTQGGGFAVTFSFGVAIFVTLPPGIDEMVCKSDELMYASKEKGKDGITYEVIGG